MRLVEKGVAVTAAQLHTRFGKPRSCALTLGEFSRLDAPILGTLLNTHPWGYTPTVLPQNPRPCVLSFGSMVVTANPGLRERAGLERAALLTTGLEAFQGPGHDLAGTQAVTPVGDATGVSARKGKALIPSRPRGSEGEEDRDSPKMAPPPALLSAHAPGWAFGVSPSQIFSVLCIRPLATKNSR